MRWVKSENRLVKYLHSPRLPHILIHAPTSSYNTKSSKFRQELICIGFTQSLWLESLVYN